MFWYFPLGSSRNHSKMPATPMMMARAIVALSAATASLGCGSSTFLPPPPEELQSAAAEESASSASVPLPPGLESASVGVRSVEIILDRRDPTEIEGERAAARMQAGIDKVKLRMSFLAEQDLPAHQVELVREAVARNPLALVVEPADPTDSRMAEVLQKARENGIPVVLLNRPLTATSSSTVASKGPEKIAKDSAASPAAANPAANPTLAFTGPKPLVLVTAPSFTESARQLVASAIRNAKNARLDPKGGAVIMMNTIGDPFTHERTLAIKSALEKNGITTIDQLSISRSVGIGAKLLTEKLKSNPKLVLVFAVDGLSTAAARQVMTELIPDRLFVQSAYAAEGNYGDMIRVGDFAAVAGFIPTWLVRKAITTAVKLSQGGVEPSRVEISVQVHDSAESSSTPQSPIYQKKSSASKKRS